MTESYASAAEAERHADEARENLAKTLSQLKENLTPQRLAHEAMAEAAASGCRCGGCHAGAYARLGRTFLGFGAQPRRVRAYRCHSREHCRHGGAEAASPA